MVVDEQSVNHGYLVFLCGYENLYCIGTNRMDNKERRKYQLVSQTEDFKKRVKEAQKSIRKAIDTCQSLAVSFSFGKDSLVCLDIARKIKSDILIINIDRGEGGDLPSAVEMYRKFAENQNLNYHRVKTPKSVFQIYEEAGSIFDVEKDDMKQNLLSGIRKAIDIFNIDCSIVGLRAEESSGRKYLRKYGTFHYSETEQIYKCKPILNWTGRQIWAYIMSENLPYLDWYDKMAKFEGGYERARYANWAGLFMKEEGRLSKLAITYPEYFRELAKEFPEIRRFI